MPSTIWGPFDSALEAAQRLGLFTDQVLDPSFGITWLSDGTLYALRPPRYDGDGNGQIVTFGVRHVVPPPPKPKGLVQNVKAWFWHQMEIQGQMAIAQGQANLAMGQALDNAIGNLYHKAVGKYRDDTEGVAFDIAAVALSIFLIATGTAEVLGVIALVGGVALLVMDGAAYGTELAGDDETAENIKDATFPFRCLAMLATLPDAFWNVGKVMVEGGKLSAEAARIDNTVARATADADRSMAAGGKAGDALAQSRAAARARKYAEIGERARGKALAARQKLAAFLSANVAGRALIAPSTLLLIKEVREDDKEDHRGKLNAWLHRYFFHVSSVHREKRT